LVRPALLNPEHDLIGAGSEIIAKLATVLEVEPAELLRISGRPNT
jgi:hypothetical protein